MVRPRLADLLRRPVAVAPMAGGPSTGGDTEQMSLWAGQGYRSATEQPAGEIIERLSATGNS